MTVFQTVLIVLPLRIVFFSTYPSDDMFLQTYLNGYTSKEFCSQKKIRDYLVNNEPIQLCSCIPAS